MNPTRKELQERIKIFRQSHHRWTGTMSSCFLDEFVRDYILLKAQEDLGEELD